MHKNHPLSREHEALRFAKASVPKREANVLGGYGALAKMLVAATESWESPDPTTAFNIALRQIRSRMERVIYDEKQRQEPIPKGPAPVRPAIGKRGETHVLRPLTRVTMKGIGYTEPPQTDEGSQEKHAA
jgi:hypothetical protein